MAKLGGRTSMKSGTSFTLYHYDGESDVIKGVVIDSEPPDDWWQRRLSALR
jgi:hypothetical protein